MVVVAVFCVCGIQLSYHPNHAAAHSMNVGDKVDSDAMSITVA